MENRSLNWQFYVANVPYLILGGDALAHYHLLPDLANSRLIHLFRQV